MGKMACGDDGDEDAEGPVGGEDQESDDSGKSEGEGFGEGAGFGSFAEEEESGGDGEDEGEVFQEGAEGEFGEDGFGAAGSEGGDEDKDGA